MGCMPNLKSFEASIYHVSMVAFDKFMGTVPKLERLNLVVNDLNVDVPGFMMEIKPIRHIWQLSSLKSLKLELNGMCSLIFDSYKILIDNHSPDVHDIHYCTVMESVGSSYPKLEVFDLESSHDTADGMEHLTSLKNLRVLKVQNDADLDQPLDRPLEKFADCEFLEILSINKWIMPQPTFISLIRFCPNLHHLRIAV